MAVILLVVGVPGALITFVGWPLPRHLPTLAGMSSALTQRGLSDTTMIDLLACLAWAAWAVLVVALSSEATAVIRAQRTRTLPGVRSAQLVAAHLVTTILLGIGALSRPAPPAQAAPPPSVLAVTSPSPTPVMVAVASLTPATAPIPTSSLSPADNPTTYVVVAHDTLWSIAERLLGDPLQWRTIYALNKGRPQPGGGALVDPHWIDPGWVLQLPTPPAPVTPAPAPDSSGTTDSPSALGAAPTTPAAPARSGPNHGSHAAPAVSPPVRETTRPESSVLTQGSGSTIAPSFLAGLATAVVVSRLRRRRSYRPKRPTAGRDLSPSAYPPAAADALGAIAPNLEGGDEEIGRPLANLDSETSRRDHTVEIGRGDQGSITLDLTTYPTVAVDGPVGDDVVRSLCGTLLAKSLDAPAELLMTATTHERLFSGLTADPPWRIVDTGNIVVRCLESELLTQARRGLEGAELDGVGGSLGVAPRLIAVLADHETNDPALPGLAARLHGTETVVIALGHHTWASATMRVEADGSISEATPPSLAGGLSGGSLFRLSIADAIGLLRPVVEATGSAGDDSESDSEPCIDRAEDWPVSSEPDPSETTAPPIWVEALGPMRIVAGGREITTGLRTVAKELLGWFLLRPEGATIEAAVDAIWPDTPPDLVSKRFWRGLANLRTALRADPTAPKPRVLVKRGQRYAIDDAEVGCDVWDFQSHLQRASIAPDPGAERGALTAAATAYRDDFLVDLGSLWIEPSREDLHRRALDVLVRLAEIEADAGDHDRAVGHVERAVDLDPYAELIWCHLMEELAQLGRTQQFRGAWEEMQRSLSEIGLDPSPASHALYQRLDQRLRERRDGSELTAARPVG